MRLALLALLLISSLSFSTLPGNVSIEGGNVSATSLVIINYTSFWAGLVGTMDTSSTADYNFPIQTQIIPDPIIYSATPNGTFTNSTLILTRLSQKPLLSQIFSPNQSDFNSSGLFSNFSVFNGFSYTLSDSPNNTFANPFSTTSCNVESTTFTCTYIYLRNNSFLGVLKFSNGTWEEPLFINNLESRQGFNGSYFDFQFMVPQDETYYLYVYPPNITVTLHSPTNTTYATTQILLNFSVYPDYLLDGCWYTLNNVSYNITNCTIPETIPLWDGIHQLTVYVNDSNGNIASDSVIFQIAAAPDEDGSDPEDPECESDSDCPNCYYCSIAHNECLLSSTSECGADSDCG